MEYPELTAEILDKFIEDLELNPRPKRKLYVDLTDKEVIQVGENDYSVNG